MRYFAILLLGISYVLTEPNDRNAGIFFRLNQKSIDYISDLASDALPQLLNKLSPPDVKVSVAKIYDTLIHEVTKPNISAKFVEGKGARADILLPYIRVSSHAQVSLVFFEYEGAFLVDIHNLTIGMEIHYSRNETTGRNVIDAPYCNVTHSDVKLIIDEDSDLNSIRDNIKDAIIGGLRTAVCETAIEALRYIDEQDVQDASLPEETTYAPQIIDIDDEGTLSITELGASLCKVDSLVKEDDDASAKTAAPTLSSPETVYPSLSWSPDLSLVYPPQFTKDDVVFGFDGGILLNGQAANDVEKPQTLNVSVLNEKMIGILISEYIPNTLLAHIYDSGIGTIHERFVPSDLPKVLSKLGKLMCSKCYLDINATLTSKPLLEINSKLGARILISGNVTFNFQGRKENYNLLHANISLHVTLKPTIRHSRVYGDVSLASVDVNVFDMAMGGIMAVPLEKLTSFVIPRVLWPQVKKRLRFALNKRGVQLPVLCGVELEHLSLSYIDHAIVVNTDFNFDLPLFVNKFKIYLGYKSQYNTNLPKYIY